MTMVAGRRRPGWPRSIALAAIAAVVLAVGAGPAAAEPPASAHTITSDRYSLSIDGRRVFIWSGELHYWRLPSPGLWRDVLEKMKASGFNGVSIYFDWGYHSPAPGVYDFAGVRDVDRLLDMASQAGLYVIARPGPYINAETDAGGFPGWVVTQAGRARSSEPDYLAAADEWMTQIDRVIARHQLTDGRGSVVLYQVENEYVGTDIAYMGHLAAKARADGITVPLYHNDIQLRGQWVPGSAGAEGLDLYGFDYYPQGNCSTTTWRPAADTEVTRRGFSPSTPGFVSEMQAGSTDAWGSTGFDRCRQAIVGPDFERVFYETNVANGVTMENHYMTFGGTSWGWLPSPGIAYTSYDYAAAITEGRLLTTKIDVQKELGYLFASVAPLTKSDVGPAVTPSSPAVRVYHRVDPDAGTGFFVLRHADSTATSLDAFTFPVETTDGAYTVPQQGTLALNGRDAKILTAGYDLDSQRLVYSTSEIMTHGPIGDRDLALLHGRTGEDGETVLRYPRQPRVTVLAGSVAATWDDVRGDLRLNYAHDGLAEVLVSDGGARPLLLLLADEATAARFWRQDTAAGMVLELGPALVRSASVRGPAEASGGSRLDLAGDTTAPSAVEVWAPPSVEAVTWNGHPLPTSVTASGSRLGQLPGPAAVALPVLTGWRYQAEAPERLPAFDDSGWTPADHATTNNPTKPPAGQPVLYADDYGFHHGDVWYRGRFASADAPTAVALTSTTGTQGIVQAWLNGGFLGSAGSGSATFAVPPGLADASGDNVLSILVRNMGHSLDLLANERHKQPRGLVSASLAGSPAPIAWRIQGSQGGESPADPVRGPMNNGGLYGERAGWSLPGYPDAGWTPVGLPFSDPLPGVAWYRTTFEMHVPAGVDASIGLTIDDPPSKAYRAQVFLNGWNVGQYINDIGPQHTFVLPNGLLRAGSRNTLAIAVISNQPGSGGLGSVSLTALGAAAGGVGVSPVTSPGFEPPRLGGLPVSAEAGTAFSGPVATLRLPASPRGAALLPSIDWGDGSTSTGTVGAGREGLVVSGRHSYGRAGRFQVRVTLSDPYDATTLAEASTTATVTTVPTGPSARSRAPASAAGPR